MKKRVKLMIAALLGFSTACSTVKSTGAAATEEQPTGEAEAAVRATGQTNADTLRTLSTQTIERIKLMYGTPSPRPQVQADTTRVENPTAKK